ncbi:hypothetical protein DSCO28_43630 [Desulfosarcina ovata subsp. sediminis]|uniref:ABC transporter domain-containing protein n=1 Tax=Desulfosarcina ovata subsp. sediminis TaxID=885957 RepID=A0A5K7ZU99_9BACT|nr:ABC transporter ATP-binding protein [Desulfosarcina ovata]BBO83797.1 hypothetical protein DSCO28_43630 [Desulfosarcina ovata subsp. sediminis]
MSSVSEAPVIAIRNLVYRYRREDSQPVLNGVNLDIYRNDYLLITGRSGSGKSTLCRTFNGFIPHFHGGVLDGDVRVAGKRVGQTAIADLFDQVAMAFQNPDAQLFCRSVEQEVAFGLESLGLPRETIAARIDTALGQTGIGELRHRDPQKLSGGEKALVLITALVALRPKVLVLDEPFANLDPANVGRVRNVLNGLHAGGVGIVLCEHRLSRAAPDATRVVVLHHGRLVADGIPAAVLSDPPAAWGLEPPLAMRVAAMKRSPALRTLAAPREPKSDPQRAIRMEPRPPRVTIDRDAPPVIEVDGLSHHSGGRTLLRDIAFALHPGECIAVVGANGAGKTTLLRHLLGLQRPTGGMVRIHGRDTRRTPVAELAREIGLAFQNPDNQFFKPTVAEEIRIGPQALGVLDNRWIEALAATFHLQPLQAQTPFRLSGGEKKRVAFAAALASKPAILALDEPTAGQDFIFRRDLRDLLARMQAGGQAVIIVTHDLTFAERTASRWLLMAGGCLLADDTPDRIMADSDLMDRAGLVPSERFQLMRMGPDA